MPTNTDYFARYILLNKLLLRREKTKLLFLHKIDELNCKKYDTKWKIASLFADLFTCFENNPNVQKKLAEVLTDKTRPSDLPKDFKVICLTPVAKYKSMEPGHHPRNERLLSFKAASEAEHFKNFEYMINFNKDRVQYIEN